MSLATFLDEIRGSARATLQAYTGDGATPLWPDARVEVGDRYLGEHAEGAGAPWVVFAFADAQYTGPRDMNTDPRTLYERRWNLEAHVWIYEAEDEEREDRDIQRIADLEAILDVIDRVVYVAGHGSIGGDGPLPQSLGIVRDVEQMRFGEQAIQLFRVGIPVTEGPVFAAVISDAEADTQGTNDGGGSGGGATDGNGLAINPPT